MHTVFIIFMLQIRKQRFIEVRTVVQDHPAYHAISLPSLQLLLLSAPALCVPVTLLK